jgi:hypothetical protein
MKFLPYLLKHLRRNWFRTALTVLAMALCIFLFCTLQTVLAEINALLEGTSARRLVTRHAVSLVFNLPLSYGARMESVPGVSGWPSRVVRRLAAGEEGGAGTEESSTADFSSFFPNLAVEPEPFFAMYPEYVLPPEQFRAFMGERRGAVIGRKLADRFGWKLGDTFYLESFIPPHRKPDGPFEFIVTGIFDTDPVKYPGTDTNLMLFDHKYLYEATGRRLGAGTVLRGDRRPREGRRGGAGDRRALRELGRPDPHRDREGLRGELRGDGGQPRPPPQRDRPRGDLHHPARGREHDEHRGARAAEGDRRPQDPRVHSRQVMGLVVAESVLIGVLGGALGIGGSQGLMWLLTHTPGIQDALAGLGLSSLSLRPLVAALGFANAVFLGFAAGFVPALGAYRARITDMLRTV